MNFASFCATVAAVLSGMVIGINMVMLLPPNENYEAAWWKVLIALVAFVGCISFIIDEAKKRR